MIYIAVPVPRKAHTTVHGQGTALTFRVGPRGRRLPVQLIDRQNKPHRHRGRLTICEVVTLPIPGEGVPSTLLRATGRRTATANLSDLLPST